MIPEPQLTYLLELLQALGSAADDFVVAGAHAMKFAVQKARGTKDVYFLRKILALCKEPLQLAPILFIFSFSPRSPSVRRLACALLCVSLRPALFSRPEASLPPPRTRAG
jgi:hypothetical protein